ncbi:cytochrome P450 49a1 [Mizuhopecten yessoensis]|uniref:Cytochrome P450 49a1 n=1 Tax=Mizuhopecten yessoensis TaxID=6573 RepID=A0A210QQ35_MIZYE|nr:cytochrome P450 49a1 [Mizuhopecten yessoensis]
MLSVIRCVAVRSEAQLVGPFVSIRCLSETSGSPDINNIKPFNNIPGPNGIYSVPYIGTTFHFKPFTDIPALDITLLQKRLHTQYGDILRFRMGGEWIVGLFHPDLCREALQLTQPRFPIRFPVWILRKYAERMGIEEGMGTVNGERWEAIRKPTQHEILRPTSLASYSPKINLVADDMVTRLREQDTIDDTLLTLYNYAIENIGMLFFNSRLGCLDGGKTADDIVRNVVFVFHALEVDIRSSFRWYRYFRTPFYNKFEQSLNTLRSILQPEVDDCISLYHTHQTEGDPGAIQDTHCLVHNLLSGGKLTVEQINSFIIDLFLSGIDSTPFSYIWRLYNGCPVRNSGWTIQNTRKNPVDGGMSDNGPGRPLFREQ